MSRPFDPENVFDSPERADARFGAEEGADAYERLAGDRRTSSVDPDATVTTNAERAVRIAMVVGQRFDVDIQRAVAATTNELEVRTFGSGDVIA
jgi:hypothetical protein